MAKAEREVSTTGLVDTKPISNRRKRRRWPEALKRRIVAETLAPGASVSMVARRHDVNANQLFTWRREMMPERPAVAEEGVAMLPVEIAPEAREPRLRRSGTIEIAFAGGARVWVRGEVSPETLRQVIELLR
jgi:transposase